jgi:hypothetical protein
LTARWTGAEEAVQLRAVELDVGCCLDAPGHQSEQVAGLAVPLADLLDTLIG